MKLKVLILGYLLCFSLISFAQNTNKIKPKEVYWIADGKKIDINRAQSGIAIPEHLEFVAVIPVTQKQIGKKFIFKWYRRGATNDYPLNTFIRKVEDIKPGDNLVILKAGRSNLKKGWVKVQVEDETDGSRLGFENKLEFWINLL